MIIVEQNKKKSTAKRLKLLPHDNRTRFHLLAARNRLDRTIVKTSTTLTRPAQLLSLVRTEPLVAILLKQQATTIEAYKEKLCGPFPSDLVPRMCGCLITHLALLMMLIHAQHRATKLNRLRGTGHISRRSCTVQQRTTGTTFWLFLHATTHNKHQTFQVVSSNSIQEIDKRRRSGTTVSCPKCMQKAHK